MIRVLLVDDHEPVRTGLTSLIGATEDLEVVGAAADGAEAVEIASSLRPDVVLMDLAMPVLDGTTATRRILANDPGVRVLVLTSFVDATLVRAALDAGATGYLLKETDPAAILDGIRATVRGDSPLHPRVARVVLDHELRSIETRAAQPSTVQPSTEGPGARLTRRELDVLELVARGCTTKQVGQALRIGERTVKTHIQSIYDRIGVHDRTSAALWFREHQRADSA